MAFNAPNGLSNDGSNSLLYFFSLLILLLIKKLTPSLENIPTADKKHKGYQDPMGKGLAPNAKTQLAKKMPTPEPVDEPKVDAKNFKDFRKGLKASPKRKGDNPQGDKAPVK